MTSGDFYLHFASEVEKQKRVNPNTAISLRLPATIAIIRAMECAEQACSDATTGFFPKDAVGTIAVTEMMGSWDGVVGGVDALVKHFVMDYLDGADILARPEL